jgi:hypothetical protein
VTASSGYASRAADRRASTSRLTSQSQSAAFRNRQAEPGFDPGDATDGYIISSGDDLKTILYSASVAYLNVSAERINMPRDERAVIWVRGQIEKNILRIPLLRAPAHHWT